jgi:asparagine synthase (glutamine-hydrolysing)
MFLACFGDDTATSTFAAASAIRHFGEGLNPSLVGEWHDHNAWVYTAQTGAPEDESATSPEGVLVGERYVVVIDGWLENFDELVATLGRTDGARVPTDVDLVHMAYLRWGSAMANYLYGEYAIAVWDRAEQTLTAIRDKVGMRPLFRARVGAGCAISNFPGALALLPGVGDAINEGYAAEFLCADTNTADETLLQNVARVPGGHLLAWHNGASAQVSRYWYPPTAIDRRPPRELIAAFRDQLNLVVKAASRTRLPLGCQISGGVDSSSVAVTLAQFVDDGSIEVSRVTGHSQVYPGLPCDETPYIDAVANVLPFAVLKLVPRYGTSSELDAYTACLRYPFYPFVATSAIRHYAEQRAKGGRVILTGEGGDELFIPTEHALRRAALNCSDQRCLLRYLRRQWQVHSLHASVMGRVRQTLAGLIGTRIENWLRRVWDGRRVPRNWAVDDAWSRSVNLLGRMTSRRDPPAARTAAVASALNGYWSSLFEWDYFQSAVLGVETRHPLASARLHEFVNRLPLRWLDGQTSLDRRLLRLAVGRFLPRSTARRVDKAEFTASALPELISIARAQFSGSPNANAGGVQVGTRQLRVQLNGVRDVWRLDAARSFASWLRHVHKYKTASKYEIRVTSRADLRL